MLSSSARLLRLLSLLAARPSWTCAELAGRMAVTDRTVRRDIAKLRDLGYTVDSDAGPWGGYRLRAGTRVPPLILDDEEALAVAVGLRGAALGGALGGDQAALSALLKLRQVLPPRIAERLGEWDDALVRLPWPEEPQLRPGMLLELAAACRRGERARLSYRDGQGRHTVRDVDPHRLVHTGRRWYFVARDVARGWRTFRADRVERLRPTGHPVEITDPPDPAEFVSRNTANGPYPLSATIRLPLPRPTRCGSYPPPSAPTGPTGRTRRSSRSAGPTRTASPAICSASAPPARPRPRTRCGRPWSAGPGNSPTTTRSTRGPWERPGTEAARPRNEGGPPGRTVPGQSFSGVRMPSRAMPRCRVRAVRSTRNRRFSTCSGVSAFSTGHWS